MGRDRIRRAKALLEKHGVVAFGMEKGRFPTFRILKNIIHPECPYANTENTPSENEVHTQPDEGTPPDIRLNTPPDSGPSTPPDRKSPKLKGNDLKDNDSSAQSGDRASLPYGKDFEEFWNHYPKKVGRKAAHRKYVTNRRKGVPPEKLLVAVKAYAKQIADKRTGEEYIMHGKTFLGPSDLWEDFVEKEEAKYICPDCNIPATGTDDFDQCPKCMLYVQNFSSSSAQRNVVRKEIARNARELQQRG